MPHLTEDDLVLHYYGELDGDAGTRAAAHLYECGACRAAFTKLERVFAMVDAAPEPVMTDGFERIVWARLQPRLEHARGGWASWFVFSPARLAWLAAIVVLVGPSLITRRPSRPPAGTSAADGAARPDVCPP